MEATLGERQRKLRGGLGAIVVLGVALLATHRGEFWPYSTYPMFSRAGKQWQRAIVREDDGIASEDRWRAFTLDQLPGRTFALGSYGIEPVELNGYLDNTLDWDAAHRDGLRALFGPLHGHALLIYRVTPGQGVQDALATPLLRLDEHDIELAPATALAGSP